MSLKEIISYLYKKCKNCQQKQCECHTRFQEKGTYEFFFHDNESCKAYVPFFYENNISNKIFELKYKANISVAHYFASLILNKTQISLKNSVLVPVPMSRSRLFEKTFNQSVLLCEALANQSENTKISYFCLKKGGGTTQKNKNQSERSQNAAYIQIDEIEDILNKDVFIVDDVIASGSTMKQCIKLIKPLAKTVNIIAIASV